MKSIIALIAISSTLALADNPPPPENRVSPEDQKIVLELAKLFFKGCTGCIHPGLDFEKNTVEVSASDLAIRDKWIKDANSDEARSMWKERIGANLPVLKADVSLAKLWRVNEFSNPLNSMMWALSTNCQGKHAAVCRPIKIIHVKIQLPPRKDDGTFWGGPLGDGGITYSFNKATGELTMGVHNNIGNLDGSATHWIDAQ